MNRYMILIQTPRGFRRQTVEAPNATAAGWLADRTAGKLHSVSREGHEVYLPWSGNTTQDRPIRWCQAAYERDGVEYIEGFTVNARNHDEAREWCQLPTGVSFVSTARPLQDTGTAMPVWAGGDEI